ncbi:MAG: hypothetical protein JNL70_04060 [Saprospiraceae bacterium]|nr:hypothetical protein [Saprospiraceae bacterium]
MEKAIHNRIGYFFILLLAISFLGFYPTYLTHFPTFSGFTSAHHFHGLMALLWILLLIVQPFLIRAKQNELHRQVGKLGYIIMPLLVYSLFWVSKVTYFKNLQTMSEAEALAILPNGTVEVFDFSILFALGMIYRKNTAYHLRFLASTGLMMLGPGLGRFLITTFGLPFPVVLLFIILSTTGIGLIWMILDIRNKKSAFPMAIFILLGISAGFINANSSSEWWQSFGKWWVNTLF